MNGKRVAIACQGGGSQCAFVAGVLKKLFEQRVQDRYRIVALSGTSGGALTAAVAWTALLEQASGRPVSIEDRLEAFWRELSAQSPQEQILDWWCVQLVRMVEAGQLPSVATSPSSPRFRAWSQLAARFIGRPEFTDLRAVLVKHLDFDRLPALLRDDSPVLLVGAADIREGTFSIFSSARREITVEALLASAAVPNLFPAVWVDGHPHWDGIFSSNPPVVAFLQKALMRGEGLPEEIWIIQVNRSRNEAIPERPCDIFDRRNQLAGNLSLGHELRMIEMVNLLISEHALTDGFRARFGVDSTQPITVRFIRMSPALQASLDYPTKLSRQPSHIARLLADGEAQAGVFLTQLRQGDQAPAISPDRPPVETH
jgi:NTE family protein